MIQCELAVSIKGGEMETSKAQIIVSVVKEEMMSFVCLLSLLLILLNCKST